MSSAYVSTATGAVVNSVTLPNDGDDEDAASVDAPFEQNADNIWRIAQGGMNPQSLTRIVQWWFPPVIAPANVPGWVPGQTSGIPDQTWVHNSIRNPSGDNSLLYAELDVPNGATLTSVSVDINPLTGRGGVPAVLPNLSLYKMSSSSTIPIVSTVFSQQDPSALQTDYEKEHSITSATLAEIVEKQFHKYLLVFTGEFGTHSQVGGLFYTGRFSFTNAATIDRGAA